MSVSMGKFLRTTKLLEPVQQVQFIVFEKFTSVFVHQIARQIVLLLVNIVHRKTAQRVMTDEILKVYPCYL